VAIVTGDAKVRLKDEVLALLADADDSRTTATLVSIRRLTTLPFSPSALMRSTLTAGTLRRATARVNAGTAHSSPLPHATLTRGG
jgi:hypothetical protein